MKRILLAKIAAPHGIKGLVKVLPYGEDLSLLDGTALYTGETGDKTLILKLKNPMGKYILASIDGINDRNGAEDICGTDLYINRDDLPDIDENDTYYIEDLIDRTVINSSKDKIGKISAVHNFGAGDLLEIKPENSHETILVPFSQPYVLAVEDEFITADLSAFSE